MATSRHKGHRWERKETEGINMESKRYSSPGRGRPGARPELLGRYAAGPDTRHLPLRPTAAGHCPGAAAGTRRGPSGTQTKSPRSKPSGPQAKRCPAVRLRAHRTAASAIAGGGTLGEPFYARTGEQHTSTTRRGELFRAVYSTRGRPRGKYSHAARRPSVGEREREERERGERRTGLRPRLAAGLASPCSASA